MSLAPVSNEEILSDLRTIEQNAINTNDTIEMARLIYVYRGLGFEANAANLERRLSNTATKG